MKTLSKTQIHKNKVAELKARFPLIVQYCKVMGSYEYYVEQQLFEAESVDAPRNTTSVSSKYKGGQYVTEATTTDDFLNVSFRAELEAFL